MLFASSVFLQIFLPLLLFLYFVLFRQLKWRNFLLLAASIFFYTWGEPQNVLFLLGSVIFNYFIAIYGLRKECSVKIRKSMLTLGITSNLILLGVFKYLSPSIFFLDGVFNYPFNLPKIALPLGISFYTFQIISYLLDTYRRENEPQRDISKLALYITFFPQLIAGPIIRYHDITNELNSRASSVDDFAIGIRRFILGLAKKVLIANQMAYLADDVFAIPLERLDTPIAWLGVVAYALQIYFDFSGYSDMAIGLGRMFGFHFLENFNYPYRSLSIKEFWQRWHISLSTWFKEYLYIPLGGNRCGWMRHNLNLFIVFLATGIWHGAAWNFVAWGIYYGVLLIGENLLWGKYLVRNPIKFLNSLYTLFLVLVGWVLFRAENLPDAVSYCAKMGAFENNQLLIWRDFLTPASVLLLILAIFIAAPYQMLMPRLAEHFRVGSVKFWEIPILLILLGVSIMCIAGNTYNPFIYFRF